jgi:hypothetical protein
MNTGDALKTRKKVSKIPKNDLAEWTEKYLKNRDIITCLIQSMEKNKDGWDIIVHAKNADKFYSVMPSIENFDDVLKKAEGNYVMIVAYNTKKNLDKLIDGWSMLAKHPNLSVMFVNPDSALDKKWIIFPHTHDKITEKASFKRGLKAMFETVEEMR